MPPSSTSVMCRAWVSGPPAVSFFFGINTSSRDQYPIQSYRCTACGFLESYARVF